MELQQFYYIPGGQYIIGIADDIINSLTHSLPPGIKQEYLYHSYPAHTVSIASFYIAKRYVTVSEFAHFIHETGFVTQAQKDGWSWAWENGWTKKKGLWWQKPFGIDELDALYTKHADTMCVLQISCNDARAYCEYLSQMTGKVIMLPTEFMWEAFATKVGIPSMEQFQELSPNKNELIADYCYNVPVKLTPSLQKRKKQVSSKNSKKKL
ncbi:MAG: SUMF1/EgtB/PvdO family nonheme iron enzyme, partial [Spirochaetota bacterium]